MKCGQVIARERAPRIAQVANSVFELTRGDLAHVGLRRIGGGGANVAVVGDAIAVLIVIAGARRGIDRGRRIARACDGCERCEQEIR
jgi:hypothetical protein